MSTRQACRVVVYLLDCDVIVVSSARLGLQLAPGLQRLAPSSSFLPRPGQTLGAPVVGGVGRVAAASCRNHWRAQNSGQPLLLGSQLAGWLAACLPADCPSRAKGRERLARSHELGLTF